LPNDAAHAGPAKQGQDVGWSSRAARGNATHMPTVFQTGKAKLTLRKVFQNINLCRAILRRDARGSRCPCSCCPQRKQALLRSVKIRCRKRLPKTTFGTPVRHDEHLGRRKPEARAPGTGASEYLRPGHPNPLVISETDLEAAAACAPPSVFLSPLLFL